MRVDIEVSYGHTSRSLVDVTCPDVYFTAGYGIAAAGAEPGAWLATHWRDKIIVPQVTRVVEAGTLDVVSPYGYSGFAVSPDCTADELARFWRLNLDVWREIGVVAAFLRFSPLLPASVEAARGLDSLRLVRRGDTVTVDTDRDRERVWNGMQGRSRTAIRKANAAGMQGRIRPARIEDVQDGAPFRSLYEQSMVRVAANPGYFFPDSYYADLVKGLGERLLVAEVLEPDGSIVAAALVLTHGRFVHYHLAGSLPVAARNGANNLLVWTILDWASSTGRSAVHLGGGLRADDNLFRFKTSFGGRRTPFWTGAVVVDQARYDALLKAHCQTTGLSISQIHDTGYFPGYRLGRSPTTPGSPHQPGTAMSAGSGESRGTQAPPHAQPSATHLRTGLAFGRSNDRAGLV